MLFSFWQVRGRVLYLGQIWWLMGLCVLVCSFSGGMEGGGIPTFSLKMRILSFDYLPIFSYSNAVEQNTEKLSI
jgi:hypothetical protein